MSEEDGIVEHLPVLTKPDFVRRYQKGEFGNASPTWDDVESFMSGTRIESTDKYHLRNRESGGVTHYNLSRKEVIQTWVDKQDETCWYCSAMCPHQYNRIQGEVVQGSHINGSGCAGVDLLYSPVIGKPMRDALKELTIRTSGLEAVGLLKHHLCPDSYEWLQFLLEAYPGHVVEFTALDIRWGTIPGYNTLFWEVRNY